MGNVTLVVLVDGLRHDYINPKTAPFVLSLAKKGVRGSVRETFAFQLRPAFFAGLYPESADIAHLYWYEPKDSPFWFTKIIPEEFFDLPYIRRYKAQIVNGVARSVEKLKGHTASRCYASASTIPYTLLSNFSFSEKNLISDARVFGPKKTLFDVLKKQKKNWLWIGYPTDDQRTQALLKSFRERIRGSHELVYLHFAELDWVGHSRGPNSKKIRETLGEIDKAIEEVYRELEKNFSKVNGLIFGDHGMVSVKKSINIKKAIEKTKLIPGKDFVYFLDSTQARFWFFDPGAKKKILSLLKKIPEGKLLTKNDINRLHFRFNHKKFGEEIFVVNEGAIIHPSFFQNDSAPKGMHGYLPEARGNWGAYIIWGYKKKFKGRNPLELVDLYPVILELMDLPIPKTSEGVNPYQ